MLQKLLILLQVGSGNKPLAKQLIAVGLTWVTIARKGIQEMPVVFNLVPVRRCLSAQLARKSSCAGRCTGAGLQQWWPVLSARTCPGGSSSCIRRKVIQCLALGISQNRFWLAVNGNRRRLDKAVGTGARVAGGRCGRCRIVAPPTGTRRAATSC